MATSPRSRQAVLLTRQQLGLQTRLVNDIPNECNRAAPQAGHALAVAELKRRYPNAILRTQTASYMYNCHGLVFASRRTCIGSSSIGNILRDDDYDEISRVNVLAGDIAIYQSDSTGELEHSAIVVHNVNSPLGPLVVSKWGELQETIHMCFQCPYLPATVRFYRVHK